jgi:hypothetical protein
MHTDYTDETDLHRFYFADFLFYIFSPKNLYIMQKTKVILFICYLVLISFTAFSQKKGLQVLPVETILGKNLINGTDIIGKEFQFPEKIREMFFEPESNFVTVQIDGKRNIGNIIQYDFENNKILWNKTIYYDIQELLKFEKLLILNDYNEAYVLDSNTGDRLSKVLNYIYFANPKFNIGVAYQYIADGGDGYYTNDLMGIDLMKCKLLWKRTVNRAYGWNDFFFLNDSTLLVVAAGLHSINIKTGGGWAHNAVTGKTHNVNNSGSVAGAVVGGILGGIVGGIIGGLIGGGGYYMHIPVYYAATSAGIDVIKDVCSNVLINNDFIYFASQERLVKIEKESGNIIWEKTFPENLNSKSSLFLDENNVYMLNHGFALRGGKQIRYGEPFLAAFDRITGGQKYFWLFGKTAPQILDYKQIDNEVFLLSQNAVMKYNLETGKRISEKIFPKNEFGELVSFSDDNLFLFVKDGFSKLQYLYKLSQMASKDLHIHTAQGAILSVDRMFNVSNTIQYNNFGKKFLTHNDYQLIEKDNVTYIVSNQGLILAELKVTAKAFLINDILYDKRARSFIKKKKKKITTY